MLDAAAAGLFGMLGIHFKANIGIRQRMWASAAKKLLKNQIDPSFNLTEFVDGAKFAYKIVRQVIAPALFCTQRVHTDTDRKRRVGIDAPPGCCRAKIWTWPTQIMKMFPQVAANSTRLEDLEVVQVIFIAWRELKSSALGSNIAQPPLSSELVC